MSAPNLYWDIALEEIARTLRPDDPTTIIETKAIRKTVLVPDEDVNVYCTFADDDAVTLWLLTSFNRVVRLHFAADTLRYQSFPLAHITFLGCEIEGTTSRMTEVPGFDLIRFRFAIKGAEMIALTLPVSRPNSVAGVEEIEFAQKLLNALVRDPAR
ncbi:MAG: hypothetical protein ACYDAR_12765 [Thermomicrobiales bacterium]